MSTPRHPSTAVAFEWDEDNEQKLALRKIYPEDVEYVWANEPEYKRNKRSRTAVWLMTGHDRLGRQLQIGLIWADETEAVLRAIAGWKID